MTATVEELSFIGVAIASAVTGIIGALRSRKPKPAETVAEDDYDLGRWHERERQDRVAQAARLHYDLERLEKAVDRQTQVLERALDRLPMLILRARSEAWSEDG